jgi:hypothetical protein
MTGRRTRNRSSEPLLPGGLPADSALVRLLADASAPAQPHELEGLAAALTAFSTTRPGHRRSPLKSVLATLLAAKALAATAAAASVGGIALAAATGSLPPSAQNAAHDLVGAPAASSPSDSVRQDASHKPTAKPTPSATPSPSLVGLCRAYGAAVATAEGKALDNPAFTVLITVAGDKDAVPTYCRALLATAPGGKPTALPTQARSHKPETHPTGAPATHPTGRPPPRTRPVAPGTHPTGAPGTHPTGRP